MNVPKLWVSAGGNTELWGERGTYIRVSYDALPPLSGSLDGSFAWLRNAAMQGKGMRFHEDSEPANVHVDSRVAEAEGAGLIVPSSFVKLVSDPELYGRIRSCTACYFAVGARLVAIPDHDGPERLLRFMNDQQCCYLWYLLLEPGGGHRIAFAWPEWLERTTAQTLEDIVVPRDVTICAESFEEFIKRLWIENEIWFGIHNGVPLTEEQRAYAETARARPISP
jgi:hypothetical protein